MLTPTTSEERELAIAVAKSARAVLRSLGISDEFDETSEYILQDLFHNYGFAGVDKMIGLSRLIQEILDK